MTNLIAQTKSEEIQSDFSRFTVYFSVPLVYSPSAKMLEKQLTKISQGRIITRNPCYIYSRASVSDDKTQRKIVLTCYEWIRDSKAVILFVDDYGHDCSTEIGYALGECKSIYGYSFHGKSLDNLRREQYEVSTKMRKLKNTTQYFEDILKRRALFSRRHLLNILKRREPDLYCINLAPIKKIFYTPETLVKQLLEV